MNPKMARKKRNLPQNSSINNTNVKVNGKKSKKKNKSDLMMDSIEQLTDHQRQAPEKQAIANTSRETSLSNKSRPINAEHTSEHNQDSAAKVGEHLLNALSYD